jgi:hypothetical protein
MTAFSPSNRIASIFVRTMGQKRWHTLLQRFGLHLSASNTAIRVITDPTVKRSPLVVYKYEPQNPNKTGLKTRY